MAAILCGLAVLSVIPILSFLSLGYLLECSGRIARTGRFRNGLVGIRKASVLGGIVVCTWLVTLPVRLVSSLWRDARLIDPDSTATAFLTGLLALMTACTLGHIGWAMIRGGRPLHFLWPAPVAFVRWFKRPGKITRMRQAAMGYLHSLRLPSYLWLGMRGFLGGVIWLAAPVGVLLFASTLEPGPGALLSLAGGLGLAVVAVYLPFLQASFAMTGSTWDLFRIRPVRERFVRAPVAFWLALATTLLFALPLYLLKIELTPSELSWLPALVFVGFIFPARLLAGWALGQGGKREEPRHVLIPWLVRFLSVPVALLYVLWVYVMQYLSWTGARSLLEQHAFLVPAPLLGL